MVFSFVLVLIYHVLLIGGSSLLPKRFALGKNIYYRSPPLKISSLILFLNEYNK
jgi:hypothetical protein